MSFSRGFLDAMPHRPLERMLRYFARLQLDESVREIVSPTTKRLIRLILFADHSIGVPINAAVYLTVPDK
jgi:hypothetical protein